MLKWIGLWAMTVDHIGAIWFDYQTPITTLIGRMAFPIFAGLVGINVMRSRYPDRYVAYLLLAAIISQPAVMWGLDRPEGIPLNVLFTLAIGAAWTSLLFRELERGTWRVMLLATGVGLMATPWVEYGLVGIFLIVLISASIEFNRWHWSVGSMPGAAVLTLAWMVNGGQAAYGAIALLTVCLVALVVEYGDRKGGDRWFFYAYYPAHLVVLALLAPAAAILQ